MGAGGFWFPAPSLQRIGHACKHLLLGSLPAPGTCTVCPRVNRGGGHVCECRRAVMEDRRPSTCEVSLSESMCAPCTSILSVMVPTHSVVVPSRRRPCTRTRSARHCTCVPPVSSAYLQTPYCMAAVSPVEHRWRTICCCPACV